MKRLFFTVIMAAAVFHAACASAATVAQSIPEEARIRSIEEAQAINRAEEAAALIEEQGEAALAVFSGESDRWLGTDDAIYVIDADEGAFILSPAAAPAGNVRPATSRAAGRKLVREAIEAEAADDDWLGFVQGEPDTLGRATAVAVTPGGKKYVVVVWIYPAQQ